MKTSIKMLVIAVATLASGAVLAEGYHHYSGVTATDVSSVSSAEVSSGSVIVTTGNGAAFSNQIVGAGAQNQASAGASAGHNGVNTAAQTSGSTGVLAVSQSGAIGHASVNAGTSAEAFQAGTAEASAANSYHHPNETATSEAGVASVSEAGTGANGFGASGVINSAGNVSHADASGHHNNVSTEAGTLGGTSNASFSLGTAGSMSIVGQEGSAWARK